MTEHLPPRKMCLEETPEVLVIDLEATCCDHGSVPKEEMEIIQIGAVVATREGVVLATWAAHVRPVRHSQLTAFCTQLTGISQSDVDAAENFPTAINKLLAWIHASAPNLECWASWGAYDQHQFKQDFDFHGLPWCLPAEHLNLKARFAKNRRLKKRPALSTALNLVGLEFSGIPHNALDDAKNAVRMLPYL